MNMSGVSFSLFAQLTFLEESLSYQILISQNLNSKILKKRAKAAGRHIWSDYIHEIEAKKGLLYFKSL